MSMMGASGTSKESTSHLHWFINMKKYSPIRRVHGFEAHLGTWKNLNPVENSHQMQELPRIQPHFASALSSDTERGGGGEEKK